MQTVFSTRGANQAEVRQRWAAFSAREFFDGALDTASTDFPELVLDQGVAFPVAVTRLISRQCMRYRRSSLSISARIAPAHASCGSSGVGRSPSCARAENSRSARVRRASSMPMRRWMGE